MKHTYLGHLLDVVSAVFIPDIVTGHRHGAGSSLARSLAHRTSVSGGGEFVGGFSHVTQRQCFLTFSLLVHFTLPFPFSYTPSSRPVILYFLHCSRTLVSWHVTRWWGCIISYHSWNLFSCFLVCLAVLLYLWTQIWFFCYKLKLEKKVCEKFWHFILKVPK